MPNEFQKTWPQILILILRSPGFELVLENYISPLSQVIVFTRFSENMTLDLDLEVKITEIWTYQRFSVDAPVVSI